MWHILHLCADQGQIKLELLSVSLMQTFSLKTEDLQLEHQKHYKALCCIMYGQHTYFWQLVSPLGLPSAFVFQEL